MKRAVRLLIAGLLLLLSPKLMWGEDYRFFSHKAKEPYSDIPVITRMSEYCLSYEVKEAPQLVEFRPVDGKGNVILKDIGKSAVIFGPESFEQDTFPPTGWSQYSLPPYSTYHWYRKENNGHDGSYVAWIDCDPNAYWYGQDELIQTPQLDFSDCEGCTLFFYLRQGQHTDDILYIAVSTDGGAPSGTWNQLVALSQTGFSWGGAYLSLSPDYDGEQSVVIGFEYAVYPYTSGGDVGLDYILVTAGSGGGEPNLKPYTPSGWSGPLVCSVNPDTISEDTLIAGQPYYLSFAIENNGTADVTDTFSLCIARNDTVFWNFRIPALPQGGTVQGKCFCDTISDPGSYNMKVVADYSSEIQESDETDNEWGRSFYWETAGTPDIWVSPESLYYYYETTGKISRVNGYWNEREVSVRVEIPDFEIETIRDGTQKINLPGFGYIGKSGAPYLPAKVFTLAIPPGAVVQEVEVTGFRNELPGAYNITPTPPFLPLGDYEKIIRRLMEQYNRNKEEVYSSDALYPEVMGRLEGRGGLRRYNLVDVALYPFAYRPVSGKLYYARNMTITIRYTMDSKKKEEALRLVSDNLADEEASGLIYNYSQTREWYKDDKGMKSLYDYVIITPSALISACDTLVNWKTSLGYNVNVVTKEWITSNYSGSDIQQKIRNFLRDKYPSSQWGIKYVLIIGDDNDIPMRRCCPINNDPDGPDDDTLMCPIPTDLYYAELTDPDDVSWNSDGDDYYGEVWNENCQPYGDDNPDYHADIHLGRIPWSNTSKIRHICEKIVRFEQDTDINYKKNSLLAGGMIFFENENGQGNALCDGAKVMEDLMNNGIIERASAITLYEKAGLAPSSYSCTDSLTEQNTICYWNNRGIFFEFNHGYPESYWRKVWATDDGDNIPEDNEIIWPPGFFSNDAPFVDDVHPALGYLMSCLCGYPELTNNLGAAFLYQGCVSVIASSRISYGSGEDWGYYFFNKLLKDTSTTHARVGDAFDAGRNDYVTNLGWEFWFNLYDFNLYGDPSLYHFGYGGDNYLYNTMQVHNSGDGTLVVSGISSKKSLVASISPSSFTVLPGGYQEVSVGVNPQGLSFGTHYDTILIVSNDPDENPYPERVVLSVILTGIEEDEDNYQLTISNYQFLRAYPNPFRTTTAITLSGYEAIDTHRSSPIALRIYDLSGRLVKSFVISHQATGEKPMTNDQYPMTVTWDGRDTDGKLVPSGIYFAKLKSGDKSLTGKLILIR